MIINKIKLFNYRHFENVDFNLSSGLNLIIGPTGSGKTTILEAIGVALFGESVIGASLYDVVKYNEELCKININILNDNVIDIKREFNIENSLLKQKIYLNDEIVYNFNINDLFDNIMDKNIFFELASIDLFRHSVLDFNINTYYEDFSSHIFGWNIKNIKNNSKSLLSYMNSYINKYSKDIQNLRVKLSESENIKSEITDLLLVKSELELKINNYEGIINDLEEKRIKTKDLKNVNLVDIENNINFLISYSKYLYDEKRKFINMQKIIDKNNDINEYIELYVNKSDLLYENNEVLIDILKNINMLTIDMFHQANIEDNEMSERLLDNIQNKNRSITELESLMDHLSNYQKILNKYEQSKEQLNDIYYRLDKENEIYRVAEHIDDILMRTWVNAYQNFLNKIKYKINEYLEEIDIDLTIKIIENKIMVTRYGMDTNIEFLSAGERSILNMLVRIVFLEEINYTDILLLDHPLALLDNVKRNMALSLLNKCKNNFKQIILTSQLDLPDLYIDTKIELPM